MKKLILVWVYLCSICITAAAADNTWHISLSKAIEQATMHSLPRSAGVAKNGGIPIYLNTDIKTEISAVQKPVHTPCLAVRIAPRYLLASLACKQKIEHIYTLHDNNTAYETPRLLDYAVTQMPLASVQVAKQTLTSFVEDNETQLLLVRLDDQAMALVKDKPIADLFFVNQTPQVIEQFDQLLINRKFLFNFRTTSSVTFNGTGADSFSVLINSKEGISGDPIFGMTKYAGNHEFLLGFNVTPYTGTQPKSGSQYRLLDAKVKQFLQVNLDKTSWSFLQRNLKDENLFK